MKTVTVRELSQNGASKVITAAESEPVLITKNNEPSAWVVSAREVALASAQVTGESAVYCSVLTVVAVDLYSKGVLSIGRAARLAGIPLAEFMLLCGRLQVPVLREPPGGLEAELEGLEAALARKGPVAAHDRSVPKTAPVRHGDPPSVRVSARVAPDLDGMSPLPEAIAEEYFTDAANLVA
jgi:prevent-host-death family protein